MFNPKRARFSKDDYDFSRLRYILNTGAKLAVPLVRKVRETFPQARLYLMYGFTEAFRSTFLDYTEVDRIPESIGKALPNVQIEVINEQNEVCQPGEIGELIHRGAGIRLLTFIDQWINNKRLIAILHLCADHCVRAFTFLRTQHIGADRLPAFGHHIDHRNIEIAKHRQRQ